MRESMNKMSDDYRLQDFASRRNLVKISKRSNRQSTCESLYTLPLTVKLRITRINELYYVACQICLSLARRVGISLPSQT